RTTRSTRRSWPSSTAAATSSRCTTRSRWGGRCSSNTWRYTTTASGSGCGRPTRSPACCGGTACSCGSGTSPGPSGGRRGWSGCRPAGGCGATWRGLCRGADLWARRGWGVVARQVVWLRRQLVRLARREEPIGRFVQLPGVAWVRAATFFAYVDTPWRFRSKSALWKYLGLGLERRHSGTGPVRLQLVRRGGRGGGGGGGGGGGAGGAGG